ncbi:MAG: hypothetical protein HC939_20495 [Pleurocapsa sp. SU_5_0]|nr:hypothetical protein [Pleurocapsa sp. SU_5_0]
MKFLKIKLRNKPMYTPVLKTQAQTFAPAQVVQLQIKQVKELTCEQLVFTIINSEIARFKREKVNVDAKTIRESYQAFYAGWTQPQLMQAAMNVVLIFDKTTKIWRLVANEAEIRQKQTEFSRRYHFFKKNTANVA